MFTITTFTSLIKTYIYFFMFLKMTYIVNSSVLLTRIACFVVYLFDMFVSALQFRQPVSFNTDLNAMKGKFYSFEVGMEL